MSYPPQGQYPSYPPGQPPPPYQPEPYPPEPGPPPERGRGCRGCLIGCLIAFLVVAALAVVAIVAGVYVVRQMYPTSESVGEAARCAFMRVILNNAEAGAEAGIQQSNASDAEKAELRRNVQELRAEFERQCGPLRP